MARLQEVEIKDLNTNDYYYLISGDVFLESFGSTDNFNQATSKRKIFRLPSPRFSIYNIDQQTKTITIHFSKSMNGGIETQHRKCKYQLTQGVYPCVYVEAHYGDEENSGYIGEWFYFYKRSTTGTGTGTGGKRSKNKTKRNNKRKSTRRKRTYRR